jgi:putative mRNA 3-end processing factor
VSPRASRQSRAVRRGPAFAFSRGVRLEGTNIACDALGAAGELIFLSHAQALGALHRRLPLRRGGRQELLVTEATLALLGSAGARLRRHALPAAFGRPFALGDTRVELFPSGHLPGAASLLVESGGRRLVYAGTVRMGAPAFGATAAEHRAADAICIDGTFGDPRFALPPPEEALAGLRAFVAETLAAGAAPVLLTPPFGTAMDVAAALAAAGVALRGHRAVVGAAAAHRDAGARPPAIARFAGKLGPGEALLWPPEAREAALLARLSPARFAFVSGFSCDPAAMAAVRADVAVPLSNQGGYAELLAQVEASGAHEVAVHRGHAEALAAALRARGLNAYALGPPRQLELFRG